MSSPCLLQLKKAHTQQQRLSATKNKEILSKKEEERILDWMMKEGLSDMTSEWRPKRLEVACHAKS